MAESPLLAKKRWRDLKALQDHYAHFADFYHDVSTGLLGFDCTDIQLDMANFLEYGPAYKMIQAQRGQAKTTVTACYGVWRLIHNPSARVLIFSAADVLASQISALIVKIITQMPELTCMRPDTTHGDRSSVSAFDVHHSLKGVDKSPSVSCLGIGSTAQGFRADVLIADDIESKKNSATAVQREKLNDLTKEFTSICSNGDIIYLGTPQTIDSVYNSLPSRGFTIRIWPGRYPTEKELPNYKDMLAPLIRKRLEADPSLQTGGGPTGDRGKPIDPVLLGEDVLIKKEIDQGKAHFQLQHMLDTKLMDDDRYPLKGSDLVFMHVPTNRVCMQFNWIRSESNKIYPPQGFPLKETYYLADPYGDEYSEYIGTSMYVDPAGGGKNGDETAYAIVKFLAGKLYLIAIGGFPGGYSDKSLDSLTAVVLKYRPSIIEVEENYGKGAFLKIWSPKLNAACKLVGHTCGLEEIWETGQKELRIIDTLEPIISSQRLVVDPEVLKSDWESTKNYPVEKRSTYSLFFQLARITRDKGSLIHDDRIDALAGACRRWVSALALDSEKEIAKIKKANWEKLISNPLGNGKKLYPGSNNGPPNLLSKFKRKH